MPKAFILVVLLCACSSSAAPCLIPTWISRSQEVAFQGFTNGLGTPMMKGRLTFCWKFDASKNSITFVLAAKNRGWIGFGVSAGGGMTNADLAIFKKDPLGNNIVEDMFSKSSYHGPRLDRVQNVKLIGSYMTGVSEVFVHVFSRPIRTCGTWDVSLNTQGSTEIITAFGKKLDYGLEFGEVRDVEAHLPGNRDTVKIDLFDGKPVDIPAEAPGASCT